MEETQSPLCKAVRNRILKLCEEKDLTINALANEAGLPPSSIKNILYGKSKNPKIATIKIICDGVNISLKSFSIPPNLTGLNRKLSKR